MWPILGGLVVGCSDSDDSTSAGATSTVPSTVRAEPSQPSLATPVVEPEEDPAGATTEATSLACDVSIDPSVDVNVVMWQSLDTRVDSLLQQWAADFHALHPSVTITFEDGGFGRVAVAAIGAMVADDRPNLVVIEDNATADALESGYFEPIGACATRDEPLVAAVEAAFTVDGVLQAAPFTVSVPLLYYDREAFARAGLDPDAPPRTFDELADTARRLVASGAADTGLILDARANAGGSWIIEQVQAQAGAFSLDHDNGRTGRPTSITWDTPEVLDALTTFRSMLLDGSAEIVTEFPNDFADLQRVIDPVHPAAMTLHTSGSLGPVLEVFDDPDRVGIAPYPVTSGADGGVMLGGRGLWMVAGAPDAERAATQAWVDYLTSTAVQAQLAAVTGYAPVRPGAVDDEAMRVASARWPQLLVAPALVAAAGTAAASAFPVTVHRDELRALQSAAVSRALVDGVEPARALADAQGQASLLVG